MEDNVNKELDAILKYFGKVGKYLVLKQLTDLTNLSYYELTKIFKKPPTDITLAEFVGLKELKKNLQKLFLD